MQKYATYTKVRKSTQKYAKVHKSTQKYTKILPAVSNAKVNIGFRPALFSTNGCESAVGIVTNVGNTNTR